MRVLIFGDSITQGYWDTDGGWADRIRKHYDSLQMADLKNRDEPTIFNLGISADNSANILHRIESETLARTRHGNLPVVIIQIGVNDASSDEQETGKGVGLPIIAYQQNLKLIIETAKPISSRIIFVGLSACDESRTTPVSWGAYYYTNKAIKEYEDVMRVVAAEHEVAFIPIFDEFMRALQGGKELLPDGLHPNNEGHELMSQIVLKELDPLLSH